MKKDLIDELLICLDKAGAGVCPITGNQIKNENILAARVAYYDLANHIRSIDLPKEIASPSHETPIDKDTNVASEQAIQSEERLPDEQNQSPSVSSQNNRPPKNSGKPWTEEDLNICLSMYHDQFSFVQIAQKIERSPWSVAVKLNHLGELGDEAVERLRIEYGKNDPIGTKKNFSRNSKKGL